MKAVVMTTPGPPDVLRLVDVPEPEPGPGEVRIAVEAACVNPVDAGIRSGRWHGSWFQGTPTLGLGWDVCGLVDALGPGAEGFRPGERVLAMNDRFTRPLGCYAEKVTVPVTTVAACPTGLDPVTASTLPLNGATADQSVALLDLPEGARVLVSGAAGAVGGFAVALADLRGWTVVGLASAADEELVRSFGAAEFVPRGTPYEDIPTVDGVVDAAQIGPPLMAAVADGGGFVAVSPATTPVPERGITVRTVKAEPIGSRLAELAELAAKGVLKPRVAGTLPLAEAAEAHRRLESEPTRARWVLVP